MRLTLVLEQRFERTPDGAVWSPVEAGGYDSWQRYRQVFPELRLVARARRVADPRPGWRRADGPGVDLASLPYYVGPLGFAFAAGALARAAWRATSADGAFLLRGPGAISSLVRRCLAARRRPYGVEVVGDPADVFAPGVVTHPLRPLVRRWYVRELRRLCRGAGAVAYVTRSYLQRRYAPAPGAFATWASDVRLPDAWFATASRDCGGAAAARIAFVGSLEQLYKGPDVLLDACARCRSRGLAVQLTVVGDGRYRSDLERRAASLGIAERVEFVGWVGDRSVLQRILDRAETFVLPSRTEGLPRAMIEAMARALPCIGTTVGGVPELLELEDMVAPGDVGALAAKLAEVLPDGSRLAAMSERNLRRAQEYREELMLARSIEFYARLKDLSARSAGVPEIA